MTDDVRWFDMLGYCRECNKPATGVLRGSRNDSYGPYCERCAAKRLARARKERAAEVFLLPDTPETLKQNFDGDW